ncbi:hypothetical protein U9M48_002092 [Paspalum notatum var. saurae]|uniref:Protein FAR1-RELATED SEQUENCE n=1 Tax=Paspalum notatum var. saurae TaxID=547442 RepID=A0AAQ3PIZ4_PASNO
MEAGAHTPNVHAHANGGGAGTCLANAVKDDNVATALLEHAPGLSCYPFMEPSLFNFNFTKQRGVPGITSFKDLVLQASTGVLHYEDISMSEDASAGVDTVVPVNAGDDSDCNGDAAIGTGGTIPVSENGETKGIGEIANNGSADFTQLNQENVAQPWPKWVQTSVYSTRLRNNCPAMIRLHRTENYGEPHYGSMIGPTGEAPWSQNSVSNLCKRIAKEQRADDVRKTLQVFKDLKKQDPGFKFCVDYDRKNKIKTLMWCGGKSTSQYSCFGDAITFDTTYCTNIYKMPFGLFVGVNNHFQSIIFAGVLMTDETSESFEWVFSNFAELMGGKKPQTVLTDQCQAMGIAIAKCWCGTAHLWCRWHVLRTTQEELGPIFNVGTPFYNQFHKIINDMLTIDEFEVAWDQMLDDYDLRDNGFMQRTYNKRHRWAKPYNNGTYCAGMTSTQRSESANHMLKNHVPRNFSMNKFVMNYNNLLLTRYKAEAEEEHRTKQNVFVHERAWPIEIHALQVYTNASYMLFRKQVDKSTRYHVSATDDPTIFLAVHDKAKRREKYARVEFKVMLKIGTSRIPDCHIMDRWTKVARENVPEDINYYKVDSVPTQTLTYRRRLLAANAARIVTEGDHDAETFEIATKHMHRAFLEIADYMKLKGPCEQNGYLSQTDGNCSQGDTGTDTDWDTCGNTYGAVGVSAGFSDSELFRLRPPEVNTREESMASKHPSNLTAGDDIINKKAQETGKESMASKYPSNLTAGDDIINEKAREE